jgi:hypothetical protein
MGVSGSPFTHGSNLIQNGNRLFGRDSFWRRIGDHLFYGPTCNFHGLELLKIECSSEFSNYIDVLPEYR